MKWAFSSVGMVAAGLVGIMIILLFQELTVNNEEDYYLLKEINEAAMIDAIDLAYYRDSGKLKIVQEKFVESFTRRFAESASVLNTQNYSLEFYDIMEIPPKVSVIVHTTTRDYTIFGNHLGTQNYGVSNKLDSILEMNNIPENLAKDNECFKTLKYVSIPTRSAGEDNYDSYHHDLGIAIRPPGDDPSGYGGDNNEYISDSDLNSNQNNVWAVESFEKIGKVEHISDLKNYGENRDKMFYIPDGFYRNIVSDYGDFDKLMRAIPQISEENFSLSITNSEGKYVMEWQASFECNEWINLLESAEEDKGLMANECLIGVMFQVTWKKMTKECRDTFGY